MAFPKQIKDIVYNLLEEPSLDKFREFIKNHTGEHNSIDFKKEWVEGAHLAKLMLAIANSGGGVIIFGVSENEDGSPELGGVESLRDPAIVSNDIKNYVSSNLKYEIYSFSYTSSEYKELQGHHYQMMVIEDTPEHIPFMAKKESGKLKTNEIYIRRGTSCEVANQEEIQKIISRRVNYAHPLNGEPLDLREHLNQLKELYKNIDSKNVRYEYENGLEGFGAGLAALLENSVFGERKRIEEPNPLYPDESYEEFVSRLITAKKNKIERILDLY